jgi:biofilm protein TabA
MILDTLSNAERYWPLHPGLRGAFDWLRGGAWEMLPAGRSDLDGARLYVNIIEAPARPRVDLRLECHRQYIDIQYIVSGVDEMGWSPLDTCRQPEGVFSTEKDCGFFLDAPRTWMAVPAGFFAVFFPCDAHAPMGGAGTIRKAVVKVAVHGWVRSPRA